MLITFIILLTLLSAFFSGSEVALFSIEGHRLASKNRDSVFSTEIKKILSTFTRKTERTITALLLGNLVVNILMTEVLEHTIQDLFVVPHPRVVMPILITLYILTFGEIIPKLIALGNNDFWILLFLQPLRIWFRIAGFFSAPFIKWAQYLLKSVRPLDAEFSEKELIEAVRYAEERALIRREERIMLSRSITFYHSTVYSALIPKSELLILSKKSTVFDAIREFKNNPKQLAVIFDKKQRLAVSVLHLRGLIHLRLLQKTELQSKLHPLMYLPHTVSLQNALKSMRENKQDTSGVIDESGAFIGLVTIRGITNHILGSSFSSDISDKYVKKIGLDRFHVLANIPLDYFNEKFHKSFVSEMSETLGGFILELNDGFPAQDKKLFKDNIVFQNFIYEQNRLFSLDVEIKIDESKVKTK